ncbi:enoyl-CoA hydratase/isomerase family protein [Ornithinibacillus halotolerans]|uniref:Crotonase n=1 Tax=Ornithinibacillus halotolerans TaxID=1274357 RepID=A0A916S528_9BACI|nr:enoyl-CoA hydratase/isomerase family protein [Ornithinibacillus halotolerans]GGA83816.1 crotonase [Ornithinibacillus halotolerans]
MTKLIRYEIFPDNFSVITINRPEKRNAISLEMANELITIMDRAEKEPIKFLVITGAGEKMFCSGGDLNDFHGELSKEEAEKRLSKMMEVLYRIAIFKVPTIALLNGSAVGGGCEIASACDIRIAKTGTKFGFVQSNLGIIPGWGGGILLSKRVHPSFANQWIMEGNILEVEQLEMKGWVHRVVPIKEFGDMKTTLQPYINKSFHQMKILKGLFKEHINVQSLKEMMMNEVQHCATLWETNEHKEAVQAFLNKS